MRYDSSVMLWKLPRLDCHPRRTGKASLVQKSERPDSRISRRSPVLGGRESLCGPGKISSGAASTARYWWRLGHRRPTLGVVVLGASWRTFVLHQRFSLADDGQGLIIVYYECRPVGLYDDGSRSTVGQSNEAVFVHRTGSCGIVVQYLATDDKARRRRYRARSRRRSWWRNGRWGRSGRRSRGLLRQ